MSLPPSSDGFQDPVHNVQPNVQPLQATPLSTSFLNIPPGHKACSCCFKYQPFDQFFRKKQTAAEAGKENEMSLLQTCASCRLITKRRDSKKIRERREAKDKEKVLLFGSYTWEQLGTMIDNGYSKC